MVMRAESWELKVLTLAQEAAHSDPAGSERSLEDVAHLDEAYAACKVVTEQHSRTFSLAASLLPPPQRRAVHALYAFCRISDDFVDRGDASQARSNLELWRERVLSNRPTPEDPVAFAWADTCHRYCIPRRAVEHLLDGVARDLETVRYDTFDDLAVYCYGVASTVGLMYMAIIGALSDLAVSYAVRLGVALQMTNILRDIGEDWRSGRVYLPREDLEAFGVTEDHFRRGVVDPSWRDLMRFEIERTRQLYAQSLPGIPLLSKDGRLAVAAAAVFYRDILVDIEAHDYDVFSRRAYVSTWGKLVRLPAAWGLSMTDFHS
jgi:15-cis-phytoene synthase